MHSFKIKLIKLKDMKIKKMKYFQIAKKFNQIFKKRKGIYGLMDLTKENQNFY